MAVRGSAAIVYSYGVGGAGGFGVVGGFSTW